MSPETLAISLQQSFLKVKTPDFLLQVSSVNLGGPSVLPEKVDLCEVSLFVDVRHGFLFCSVSFWMRRG